jgi:pilus assembly protein CpaE
MLPLTVGLVMQSKALWDEVQACLQTLPARVVLEQAEVGDRATFLDRIERLRPDVVLIDVIKIQDSLEEVVMQIKATSADPMVIALHTSADSEIILGALRAGANEFLFPPLQANLRKALERKTNEHGKGRDGGRSKGKALAFLSVKGGCGATTIACHTSVELGRKGQQVLLADLDFDAGIVRFLMKSKCPYSVLDAVNNLHRLDLSYWKALISNGFPNVEVIAAPDSMSFKAPIAHEQLQHILGFARSLYDWTVVDLGRSLSLMAVQVLEEIDEAYLVTTLDVPALHQAKQIVQTLLNTGYGRNRLRLVLNRMPQRLDVTPEELEKMLGLPVYCMLPSDYSALYDSYSEGKLLPPNTSLGKHLVRFADKLAGITEEKNKRRFSLFG